MHWHCRSSKVNPLGLAYHLLSIEELLEITLLFTNTIPLMSPIRIEQHLSHFLTCILVKDDTRWYSTQREKADSTSCWSVLLRCLQRTLKKKKNTREDQEKVHPPENLGRGLISSKKFGSTCLTNWFSWLGRGTSCPTRQVASFKVRFEKTNKNIICKCWSSYT